MSEPLKLAETCACGAQFSVSDAYHHAKYVYEQLERWRKEHRCPLRDALEGGAVRDSKLTDRFDWNSRDGVTFDAGRDALEGK